ncbi:MAG: ABC transporter [Actinomycetota bacterium]|nr:ABC transporter [Actinomycetota bacterium]
MRRAALLVLPAAIPTVLVLGTALAMGTAQSFGLAPITGPPNASLAAYREVGGDGELWSAMTISITIAVVATAIAVIVGFATALAATSTRRGGRMLTGLAVSTIPVPHVIGAAAIGLLLADSGWLARLFGATTDTWPQFVGGPWWTAVILEYAWKESAFIALVVMATLARDAAELSETAAVLGASATARIRHISAPLAAPALIIAGTLSFIYALGSFEVPWLLGRTYPEPLPVLAYRLFTSTDLGVRPQALAVSMVTVAIALTFGMTALALVRRRTVTT